MTPFIPASVCPGTMQANSYSPGTVGAVNKATPCLPPLSSTLVSLSPSRKTKSWISTPLFVSSTHTVCPALTVKLSGTNFIVSSIVIVIMWSAGGSPVFAQPPSLPPQAASSQTNSPTAAIRHFPPADRRDTARSRSAAIGSEERAEIGQHSLRIAAFLDFREAEPLVAAPAQQAEQLRPGIPFIGQVVNVN